MAIASGGIEFSLRSIIFFSPMRLIAARSHSRTPANSAAKHKQNAVPFAES
jgi:hypothetical protein